jgi:hypothetical protein
MEVLLDPSKTDVSIGMSQREVIDQAEMKL